MLHFTLGVHNRTVSDWRDPSNRRGPFIVARQHAAKHGAAGVWRADGSFRLFYRDGKGIRQKTFAKACPA